MQLGSGWKVVQIDEVEPRPWQDTELAWLPLREALGTRIVGMAAFTADRVGQELIEGHDEGQDGRGQEEVYVVLRGRATFVLDGREVDAPAGTLVRVEPGSAVLALGGPPTFEPSASEWIERARPFVRSDPAKARQIVDELRSVKPESPGVAIAEALLAIGEREDGLARRILHTVLGEEPGLRPTLERDPDLGPLLKDER
jgi:hypothetical protein